MKTILPLSIAAFGLAAFNLSAATLHVSLESTNPVPPFATWATAATNIQDAVDATQVGDTVLVTNGVYATGGKTNEWGGIENRVTITNAIRLESVNGPLVTIIMGSTILTNELGEEVGREGGRCVYLGSNAALSGFTLTNGNSWGGEGGGILCEPSGVVTNCVLTGNSGFSSGEFSWGEGGGAKGGILYNCTLTGNSAVWGGGAFGSTLYNCAVTGNTAWRGAGGAYGSTLYNCTLTGNSAWWSMSATPGGGVYGSTLYNCTLTGNSGGGASWSTLYNCTVTGNAGGGVGGGTLYNSIVYYNYGGNYGEGTTLNFSCTTPLPTNGVGNLASPPLFMDFAAGDYRLWENSPCIDAGTNLVGLGIVPVEIYATDILGNTRFIDGDFDGVVAWDMGAYEFDSFKPPCFTCPPQRLPNCWRLNITGAANQWLHVQRSSDMKNWENCWSGWMGSEGVKQVDDVDLSQTVMFYRAVVD